MLVGSVIIPTVAAWQFHKEKPYSEACSRRISSGRAKIPVIVVFVYQSKWYYYTRYTGIFIPKNTTYKNTKKTGIKKQIFGTDSTRFLVQLYLIFGIVSTIFLVQANTIFFGTFVFSVPRIWYDNTTKSWYRNPVCAYQNPE